jgi:hypothetical protein
VLLQQLVIQQPGQPAKAQQQVGLQIEQQPQVGPLAHQQRQPGLQRGIQPQLGLPLGQLFFQRWDQIIIHGLNECQPLDLTYLNSYYTYVIIIFSIIN